MQKDFHFYEPTQGHGLRHDPISSIVGPRVIGWIGTKSKEGVLNLAPYSFCNVFNYRPPVIAFSSVGYKDSVRNAIETGVFTWNLATRDLAEPMNMTSLEQDVREFEVAGLTPVDSRLIDAPRVGESHASLECKVTTHFQLKDSEGKDLNTWMVLGEVVGVHVSPNSIVDGIYRTAIPRPILRGGGPGDYFEITDLALFDMPRPKS
ncbi:flavin reductase family protein [Alcaligenes nematophilus]|uniref:Flavin reductase family protein n=3 Tax=Alcaligenes TaxID=507 RepID=A0AAE9HB53_ALCFA|nr:MULTISPECIES: flavin reductase family protein [Alcaligenes]MDH4867531.1 flavin reductase family protein [Bacillus cereus]ASC90497.1 Asp/Glu/hydantoin racemase [Alcaligenes faecalis]KGP02658.1 Asp/Glu/hydantoin racemase [Alcaligenes faecalis]KVX06041.1 Asp/Glu/hydantoin racemase [Alcaligenes faecalis]MCB4322666.1 flavin reductase family protein [Alcaligenes sp. 13f]